jgi:hypothetical protein
MTLPQKICWAIEPFAVREPLGQLREFTDISDHRSFARKFLLDPAFLTHLRVGKTKDLFSVPVARWAPYALRAALWVSPLPAARER